jgi:hypothetical protein
MSQLSTITASDPIWSATPLGYSQNITLNVKQFTFQIEANGGYIAANLTISAPVSWLDEFYFNGLGRHITIKDEGLNTIWEGFVNRIVYNYAEQAMVIGPLSNVANRIKLLFTPYIDITIDPPTVGSVQETVYSQDLVSQALWGIREAIISTGNLIVPSTIGGGAADEATQVRQAYLAFMASPEKSQEIQYGGSIEPGIILECLGYSAMFEIYTHTDNDVGYETFTNKVKSVLASDPNSIWNAWQGLIQTNALLIAQKDRNRTAQTILLDVASKGDVNYDRWIYGVYNERRVYYRLVPSTYRYIFRAPWLYDSGTGNVVQPWAVRPGNWIFYADMVQKVKETLSSDLEVNEQSSLYGFIESVNFTSPYNVQLSGRRVSTIGQLLSQKGLGL